MLLSMAGFLSAQIPQSDSLPRPDPTRYRIGLQFGIDSRSDNPDVIIPGFLAECGRLTEGSGRGFHVGLLFESVAFLGPFAMEVDLGIARLSGTLRHRGDPFPVRSDADAVVNGRVDELLDYSTTGLDLTAVLLVPISRTFTGLVGAGGWFRLHTEETHREVAVEPEELLLSTGQREMEVNAGTLLTYNPLLPHAVVGLRYDLPIGGGSFLSPQGRLSYSFWDHVDEGSWRSFTFSLGAALRFGLPEKAQDQIVLPPQEEIPLPVLIADLRTAPAVVEVQITEYDSSEGLPLLNRVFFDHESGTIPERYNLVDLAGSVDFTTASLDGPPLDVYHDLLNIVGFRMQRLPDARLTITGHRNGRENVEGLDLARATAVRDYLLEVWDILPERIEVRAGGYPPRPTLERSDEGFAENAMATLVPSDLNLMLPLIRRYVHRIATPPSVTFYPKAISEPGVRSWMIEIDGDDGLWRRIEGEGELPDSVRWDWRSDSGALPSLPIELRYRLMVVDSIGQSASTPLTPIAVSLTTLQEKLERRDQDTIIESYSLLLFDYNSTEVSGADRALIRAIAGRVSAGAVVRFTGYTDSLGDESINHDLATRRAAEAATIFRAHAPDEVSILISPLGGEREEFPNGTPEGRAYNRTVLIEVRTPSRRGE